VLVDVAKSGGHDRNQNPARLVEPTLSLSSDVIGGVVTSRAQVKNTHGG